MKPSRQVVRQPPDKIGGYAHPLLQPLNGNPELDDDTAMADIYSEPAAGSVSRKPRSHHLGTHFKVKHLAEARLLQISEQLSRLADEVRYLNPLLAEAIDDAWEATDDALELIDAEP